MLWASWRRLDLISVCYNFKRPPFAFGRDAEDLLLS